MIVSVTNEGIEEDEVLEGLEQSKLIVIETLAAREETNMVKRKTFSFQF